MCFPRSLSGSTSQLASSRFGLAVKLPQATALRWVASGSPWPGDLDKPGSWKSKLLKDAQGFPTVAGSIGGKAAAFRILLQGTMLSLPEKTLADIRPERIGPVTAAGALYLASVVRVGPGCPWQLLHSGSPPFDGIEPDEPAVSINGFRFATNYPRLPSRADLWPAAPRCGPLRPRILGVLLFNSPEGRYSAHWAECRVS